MIIVESKGKWDQLNVCQGFIQADVKNIVTCLRMFVEQTESLQRNDHQSLSSSSFCLLKVLIIDLIFQVTISRLEEIENGLHVYFSFNPSVSGKE